MYMVFRKLIADPPPSPTTTTTLLLGMLCMYFVCTYIHMYIYEYSCKG